MILIKFGQSKCNFQNCISKLFYSVTRLGELKKCINFKSCYKTSYSFLRYNYTNNMSALHLIYIERFIRNYYLKLQILHLSHAIVFHLRIGMLIGCGN